MDKRGVEEEEGLKIAGLLQTDLWLLKQLKPLKKEVYRDK